MRTLNLLDKGFLGRAGSSPSGPSLPSDLTGLVRWYKADSFVLSDGASIGGVGTNWIDQSASAANLSQSDSGSRPVFKTNIFGSMPAIRFTPNQWLDMSLFDVTDYTILIVGKFNADSVILGSSAENRQIRVLRSGANTISAYFGNTDAVSDVLANAANTVRLMTWLRGGGSPQDRFRENKTARGGADDSGETTLLDYVGRTSFGGYTDGDIGEICVYSAVQTSANIDALYDNYFKARWGLP